MLGNLIITYPLMAQDKDTTLNEVENATYHEYMHLISKDIAMNRSDDMSKIRTLLEHMVEEGRAVVFTKQQMNGYQSSITMSIKADKPLLFYKAYLNKENDSTSNDNSSTIDVLNETVRFKISEN